MIPVDVLTAWRVGHPWPDDEQVEQDLLMTRLVIGIAAHPDLRDRLAWRGGTCLHKLFLPTPLRYSEDLDYVAYGLSVDDNDMRVLRAAIAEVAVAAGATIAKPKTTRQRLTEHLTYTSVNGTRRRVKIEVNLDEVPAAELLEARPLTVHTGWWSGATDVLTFSPPS